MFMFAAPRRARTRRSPVTAPPCWNRCRPLRNTVRDTRARPARAPIPVQWQHLRKLWRLRGEEACRRDPMLDRLGISADLIGNVLKAPSVCRIASWSRSFRAISAYGRRRTLGDGWVTGASQASVTDGRMFEALIRVRGRGSTVRLAATIVTGRPSNIDREEVPGREARSTRPYERRAAWSAAREHLSDQRTDAARIAAADNGDRVRRPRTVGNRRQRTPQAIAIAVLRRQAGATASVPTPPWGRPSLRRRRRRRACGRARSSRGRALTSSRRNPRVAGVLGRAARDPLRLGRASRRRPAVASRRTQ